MTADREIGARLQHARDELFNKPGLGNVPIDFDVDEIDRLIEALQRPEELQSCASTSNYPVMAERALRLVTRNRVSDSEAIEGICHLVDCAGFHYAKQAVEDDDAVPF